MPKLICVQSKCMQIVSQQYSIHKFYEHVDVIPLVTQDANPAKEFLTVKLKPIDYVYLRVCLLLIIITNSCSVIN